MDLIPLLPKEQQEALLNGPALAPPDGVTPQFDNPPNNNGLGYAVLTLCTAIATICLLIRGYAKIVLYGKVNIEDCMIFVTYGIFLGWITFTYLFAANIGYFVHQWDLRLRDMITLAFYAHYAGVLYSIGLPLIKMAILKEWVRLLVPRGTRNAFMWCCYALMAMQSMVLIAFPFALCFVCIPYEKIWDFTLPGKCIVKGDVEVAAAAVHLTSDVLMLILPQKVIWSLQMSLRNRFGVSVFFSLGLLACISAAFRLSVTLSYTSVVDVSYVGGSVLFWATAELTCGFIVACLPSMPKILKETGALAAMKKGLKSVVGLKNTTLKSNTKGTTASSNPTSTYRKIDEFGVPMKDLQASESTEQLRDDDKHEAGIVRTTRVTVEQEYASDAQGKVLGHNDYWRDQNRV
ncbi:hypothetical protein GGS23DRAFT_312162 [Durotheca rogersii]|uniref:uncharacterized protein n=1 Tax=Durotheca rogersii TaxID=419775 RepID=UPI00221F6057|nr:uncharacterized protein GGS23DRAFT_312162 [Durotheca rogersii]KAI5859538.1 hypothetical protein GGS23DRAFT_312162 [Durotheca rogersii]